MNFVILNCKDLCFRNKFIYIINIFILLRSIYMKEYKPWLLTMSKVCKYMKRSYIEIYE